jgi:D-tyrosyl-tRNA(Tyr) deacylase
VRHGLRPSWFDAAAPEVAKPLYQFFIAAVGTLLDEVMSGSFQRMMQLELVNDGPVTILLDSRKQF